MIENTTAKDIVFELTCELNKHFASKYVSVECKPDYIEIKIRNFFGVFITTVMYNEFNRVSPKVIVNDIVKSFICRSTDEESADGTR